MPTILITEDDPLLVKMYQTKLSLEGFTVLTAGNGEEALAVVKQHKPDFVICDVMMPKLSGLDFVQQLRSDPALASTPVIMLSNLSQASEIERGKQLGVKEFLLKANFTPSQIVEKIKTYLK